VGTAQTNAIDVAAYIICARNRQGERISQLKLHKLLYYAQAWHLAFESRPLFDDEIQAWAHGPVVKAVYRKYRSRRWSSVPIPAEVPHLPKQARQNIDIVLENYGDLSAYELEKLSHLYPPWIESRKGIPDGQSSTAVITHASILSCYSQF